MSERIPRINELVKQQLNTIIMSEIEFPRNCLVTIMRVETSKDLRHARILISVMPTFYIPKVLEKLRKNKGHLEYELHQKLAMKPLPKLNFRIDETEKRAGEIEKLLDRIKENG